jgi:pimeloyl-ACP methyl ester carboxylesterase
MMGAAWEKLTPEERTEIAGVVSANIKTASRFSWNSIYRAITDRIDFIQVLAETRVPILYLYGEDSRYRAVVDMNVRSFESFNQTVEVVAFKGGIHELHLQYPHEVAGMILQFLGGEPANRVVADGVESPGSSEDSGPEQRIH